MTRTLHVIPVGLSIEAEIERGLLTVLGSALAPSELPPLAQTVREALNVNSNAGSLDVDALLTRKQRAAIHAAASKSSAEWTSVKAVEDQRRAVADDSAYVSLASDTHQGLRAAVLLAERYRRGAVRYLDEPLESGHLVLEPGEVVICRIPGLDLGRVTPTPHTWCSLGAIGRIVADTAGPTGTGDWQVVLHLSGGYKAMIPYLMVLAESVRSRVDKRTPDAPRISLRAISIHEDSLDPERSNSPVVIDAPVRALENDLLAQACKLRDAAKPGSDIVPAGVAENLRGQFIEYRNESTRRLNASGLILVNAL